MAFTIGRAGKTLPLSNPMLWENSGGLLGRKGLQSITVTGTAGPLSPTTDILRLRDQLLGLDGNMDEEVVPVVCDAEPRLTGFYRILGVQVVTDPAALAKGWLRFKVVMEQVTGFASPQFESIWVAGLMTNILGNVAADAAMAAYVPGVATEYALLRPTWSGGTPLTRTTADGSTLSIAELVSNLPGPVSTRYFVPPQSHYMAGAMLEMGAVLQPVVGRQMAQADPYNWRLSNGSVRVWADTVTNGMINVQTFQGTWSQALGYKFFIGGNVVNAFNTLTVLRNSPEEVIIRLGISTALGIYFYGRNSIDLSVRRGSYLVRGYLMVDTAQTLQIARAVADACTAEALLGAGTISSGIWSTAGDTGSVRMAMLSVQQAMTQDLVNGKLTTTAAQKQMDFCIAEHAASVTIDERQEYLGASGEKMQLVAR